MSGPMNDTTLALLSGPPRRSYDNYFGVIFTLTLIAFIAAGLYLKTVKPLPVQYNEKRITQVKTQFVMAEKKKPPPPKPKPVAREKEVIDLTKAPLLNQKQDFAAPQTAPEQIKQAARPVYGLRRVFSTGLGAGGAVSDAVIGKLGNTLDKDVDTVTATKQDLAGPLVSISTVTTAPRIRKEVKPEATKEMIAAKIEGVIRVALLIDVDGRVKEVKILSDLGYGTGELARKAFLQCEFEPAMRDGKPVAVWFTYSMRFQALE
jgi:TonB family protein